jgi:hypothetical protein
MIYDEVFSMEDGLTIQSLTFTEFNLVSKTVDSLRGIWVFKAPNWFWGTHRL